MPDRMLVVCFIPFNDLDLHRGGLVHYSHLVGKDVEAHVSFSFFSMAVNFFSMVFAPEDFEVILLNARFLVACFEFWRDNFFKFILIFLINFLLVVKVFYQGCQN